MLPQKQFTRNNLKSIFRDGVKGTQERVSSWSVPSTSRAGLTHRVDTEWRGGAVWAGCRCEAGRVHRPCKHGLWVIRQTYDDPFLLYMLRCHAAGELPALLLPHHLNHYLHLLGADVLAGLAEIDMPTRRAA